MSIRKALQLIDVHYRTLALYMKVVREKESIFHGNFGHKQSRRVVNDVLEIELAEYILKAAAIFYGITMYELRSMACKLSLANK